MIKSWATTLFYHKYLVFAGAGQEFLKVRQDRASLCRRLRLKRLHADFPGHMGDDKEGFEQGANPLIRRHDPCILRIVG